MVFCVSVSRKFHITVKNTKLFSLVSTGIKLQTLATCRHFAFDHEIRCHLLSAVNKHDTKLSYDQL